MSGKDLYSQTIVVSIMENNTFDSDDAFPVSFPNIFIDYPLGEMRTTDMKWKHWNTEPLRLWQAQLNFVMFCASSIRRVSSEQFSYEKDGIHG